MIVLDASATLELLLNTPLAEQVANHALVAGVSLHAPHLIDVEIAQVLRRLVRKQQIDSARALTAFEDLRDLGITRYPHDVLLEGIWTLRDNATAYDAAYVALSLALDATLVTGDEALATIPAKGLRVHIVR